MSVPFPLPNIVLSDLRAAHPREVFRVTTAALERAEGINAEALTALLMAAEKKGGSAIGEGVAVVSACVPPQLTAQRICALVKLARPVMFRGVDQHSCDLVFIMASPDDAVQAHLRDLSVIIRALRDETLLESLRQAESAERVMALLRARNGADRAVA